MRRGGGSWKGRERAQAQQTRLKVLLDRLWEELADVPVGNNLPGGAAAARLRGRARRELRRRVLSAALGALLLAAVRWAVAAAVLQIRHRAALVVVVEAVECAALLLLVAARLVQRRHPALGGLARLLLLPRLGSPRGGPRRRHLAAGGGGAAGVRGRRALVEHVPALLALRRRSLALLSRSLLLLLRLALLRLRHVVPVAADNHAAVVERVAEQQRVPQALRRHVQPAEEVPRQQHLADRLHELLSLLRVALARRDRDLPEVGVDHFGAELVQLREQEPEELAHDDAHEAQQQRVAEARRRGGEPAVELREEAVGVGVAALRGVGEPVAHERPQQAERLRRRLRAPDLRRLRRRRRARRGVEAQVRQHVRVDDGAHRQVVELQLHARAAVGAGEAHLRARWDAMRRDAAGVSEAPVSTSNSR